MQRRKLGRFDLELSVVGLGGVVVMGRPQEGVDRDVAWAVEQGINYFDVAPTYGDAEDRLGPALQRYRDGVVLACKTQQRSAEGSRHELEQSLRKLRTDHFDIYQMHGFTKVEEVERALAPGGAIETFEDAKARGLTRLIGFSAHDEPAARMAVDSGRFDTILFPINYRTWETGFGPTVIEAARRRGMGILALKAMARTRVPKGQPKTCINCWYQPEDRPEVAAELLRWTLSVDGVTAAVPPGNPDLWRDAVAIARDLTPIREPEVMHLRAAMGDVAPLFPPAHVG